MCKRLELVTHFFPINPSTYDISLTIMKVVKILQFDGTRGTKEAN